MCGACGRPSRRIYDRKLRFAFFVGRRCRTSTIQDVARELHLDWSTVKELDKQYMQEQLRRAGTPAPRALGIDEVPIRKGHTYRIVVSDLGRRPPIWFGGRDRSEASMDLFYQWLGAAKCKRVRLAVMDMWKPFRNSTRRHAAQASILFDKFHVMRREAWARRFFENWKTALKWQRLKPYEKFAAMIDRHWDGIAAYCRPENKVSLGFVEGLNNKIRVLQRRAYGLRDEQYLRLKILTCMLPEI